MQGKKKNLPRMSIAESLNPWLNDLSVQGREQVEQELARQRRALERMTKRKMLQRTARRIIQRSQHRVNYIIADELVKGAKA